MVKVFNPTQAQEKLIPGLLNQLGGRVVGVFVQAPAESIVVNVIMWIMSIVGILSVALIIYGGVIYATSGGNEKKVEQAKKILLYAIIGLVVAIMALVIARVVTVVITGGDACEVLDTNATPSRLSCETTPCRDLAICTYPGIVCTPTSKECPSERPFWGKIDNMCGCYR